MIRKIYKYFMNDHLYRNSIFLMMSTFVSAGFGFFFWIVIARLFPTKSVGIATTLISAMTLLNSFSFLGFNSSLIRYLPKSTKRNAKINSVFLLIIGASIVSSFIFILLTNFFSAQLNFLHSNLLYAASFSLFIIGSTFSQMIDSIFVAYRATVNVLIKSSILSILKLIFPIFFIFIGSYGIFSSVALATLISAITGFFILIFKYNYVPAISFDKQVIKQMAFFSSGNYVAGFLSLAPAQLLSFLIINKLNSESAAYYYVSSMILSFLTIIASSTTSSLLAEGSYNDKELIKHFIKALRISYLFLIPAIIVTIFFGNIILHAFGKNYAVEAFNFLRIISVSSLFMTISTLGSSILKIRHQIKTLIVLNALGAIFVLSLSNAFINKGLIGVGYGWLFGQLLLAAVYIVVMGKEFIMPFLMPLKINNN